MSTLSISPKSIFTTPWPAPLLSPSEVLAIQSRRKTITCAVQINGKLRFTTTVPAPPTDANNKIVKNSPEHEEAVITAVLDTDEGRMWLRERNSWERRKRVVVVGGGRVVNVVF